MSKPPTAEQLRDLLCDLFRGGDELVLFLTAAPRLRGLLYEELRESTSDLPSLATDVADAALRSGRQPDLLEALAIRFPGRRAAIDALAPGRPPRGAHLVGGLSLPILSARGLAILLLASALALPWIATWQDALKQPVQTSGSAEPATLIMIQYRPEEVLIPGGSFWMGSTVEEREAFAADNADILRQMDDEARHKVEVGSLLVARTEVTLAQWEAVMGTRPNDCEYGCGDEHPVSSVSWNDACAYADALTRLENELRQQRGERALTSCYVRDGDTWTWPERKRDCTGFRLPTETEWEYFARADTESAFSFGERPEDLCTHGNVADEAAKREHPEWVIAPCDDKYAGLAPVGSFTANPWGLYDIHGNVWEWAWDWYEAHPQSADDKNVDRSDKAGAAADKSVITDDKRGYAGPKSGEFRVLRGGSFWDEPWGARSAFRLRYQPTYLFPDLGFRVVRGPL